MVVKSKLKKIKKSVVSSEPHDMVVVLLLGVVEVEVEVGGSGTRSLACVCVCISRAFECPKKAQSVPPVDGVTVHRSPPPHFVHLCMFSELGTANGWLLVVVVV